MQEYKAKISANIVNEENFVKSYCEKLNETLRIQTTNKSSRYYRCKHRTRYEKTREVASYLENHPSASYLENHPPASYLENHPGIMLQNTNCNFSMSIKPDPKSTDFESSKIVCTENNSFFWRGIL